MGSIISTFGLGFWREQAVEGRHREHSLSNRDMNFGANRKLGFRWAGVPIALASAVAIWLVALLSFGSYGAAMTLGRVRPLRNAYQFLSKSYDRLIDQIGHEVLQDSRDTPALRLMVSLSLSAIPIFLIQLALGKPRVLLAIAFYLSLYGLKFQRFVRMFSAKHLEAHRRQGYFSKKYDKVFGRYFEFFLGISMETFRNSIGLFMSISIIERMADSMTPRSHGATIEQVDWISSGISLTTFGRF